MIISNIEINKNKFEEFIRVLLLEKYEILDGNSGKNVFFEVIENFEKIEVKAVLTNEKFLEDNEKEIEENSKIKIEVLKDFEIKMLDKAKILKEIDFSYEKICDDYFDQAEVMMKTVLMKLFGKEKSYKWGTLIGVRPTKIVGRFLKMGLSYEKISEILENIYLVSEMKRDLLIGIVKRQEPYLDKETIGIYIGIAFCPTKCSYCSFPAYLLRGKYAERYSEYIESIYREIREIGELTRELNLKINTIYIGGGTPSILTAEEIKKMLETIKESYDLSYLKEFTFEAGRIDTLNEEKLTIIKNYGINKISINPQSFNETTEDILHTMDEVAKYDMENLTIHNLAIKNASKLNKENYKHKDVLDYEMIFKKIDEVTMNKGLKPYYMYRQKNSFQWGENLGYALDNCESIYNIEMIEENKTIIGIGAGAITKLIWQDEMLKKDNIKRIVNPKDPLVWMNELDERLEKKKGEIKKLFKK